MEVTKVGKVPLRGLEELGAAKKTGTNVKLRSKLVIGISLTQIDQKLRLS